MLPDILSRPFQSIFPQYHWFFRTMHTPIVLVLSCKAFSQFFEVHYRTYVFKLVGLGIIVHYLLDFLQKTVNSGGYQWLFPFSSWGYQFGLFWQKESLNIVPLLVLLVLIDIILQKKRFFLLKLKKFFLHIS